MDSELENGLGSISAIDGRYRGKVKSLVGYFSEYSFIRYRILIEIEYLIALSKIDLIDNFSPEETAYLKSIYQDFNMEDAKKVKQIESKIKHDVKSIEYYLKSKILENQVLEEKEYLFCPFCSHFAGYKQFCE